MNKSQINKINQQVEVEAAHYLGDMPQVEEYESVGTGIERWGLAVTQVIAEIIQAFGAPALVLVFGALEADRIFKSSLALGQSHNAAGLIALALVAANVIHPIYSLRQHRGSGSIERKSGTLFDLGRWLRWKVAGNGKVENLPPEYNPTLHLAAVALTVATLLLSFYDILLPFLGGSWGDMLAQISRPGSFMQLAGGALLSIGAVYFLQSAAHEIGVRLVQGSEAKARHARALAEYQAARAEIYERVKYEVLNPEPELVQHERQREYEELAQADFLSLPLMEMSANGSDKSA